jgi:hypothetical protein
MTINILTILLLGIFINFSTCKNKNKSLEVILPRYDPNFTIVAHTDTGFTKKNRKVTVFGDPIYTYSDVEDSKLIYSANIITQYLDNNEDGTVDKINFLIALTINNIALFMWKQEFKYTLIHKI